MVRLPFRHSPKIASRNARLHRLKAAGIIAPTSKASQRQAADTAAATAHITTIPTGKRTTKTRTGE